MSARCAFQSRAKPRLTHPWSIPYTALNSRCTQTALSTFARSEEKRKHNCALCGWVSLSLLFIFALLLGLLFPRPPSITVSNTAATATSSPDGSFVFDLSASVHADATSSYAPWAIRGLSVSLLGPGSTAAVATLSSVQTFTAAPRKASTFSVRASISSLSLQSLIPALSLLESLAAGAAPAATLEFVFTPVYLGVSLPKQHLVVSVPLSAKGLP